MKSLLILLMIILSFKAFSECHLAESRSPHSHFTLSNGVKVPLPTNSSHFDFLMVMGWLNGKKTAELLGEYGQKPVTLGGKALGMLSSYSYKKSDLGIFNEVYFVIPALPLDDDTVFENIWEILKAFSWNPLSPSKKLNFFHLHAYSSHENSRLASEEIWGISSRDGIIRFVENRKNMSFRLFEKDRLILLFEALKKPVLLNPLGANYHLTASGTHGMINGVLTKSPVESCGWTRYSAFSPRRHRLWLGDSDLKRDLDQLEFRPFRVEQGDHLQASQEGPMVNSPESEGN